MGIRWISVHQTPANSWHRTINLFLQPDSPHLGRPHYPPQILIMWKGSPATGPSRGPVALPCLPDLHTADQDGETVGQLPFNGKQQRGLLAAMITLNVRRALTPRRPCPAPPSAGCVPQATSIPRAPTFVRNRLFSATIASPSVLGLLLPN